VSRRPVDPARRCVPYDEWPAGDRRLWTAAFAPSAWFDQQPPQLSTATVTKYRDGYGRWLGFLAHIGELDAQAAPGERVTPDRAGRFLALMRQLGNRDCTIVGRFAELRAVLQLIASDRDWRWLTSPGGTALRSCFELAKRDFLVPHSQQLFEWGIQLMQEATAASGPARRQVMLRDGLLIAIAAARGLRLRSLLGLRLGTNILKLGEEWFIALRESDEKTEDPIAYPLPAELTPWIERYVAKEREELRRGNATDAFWIGWAGRPLTIRGLEKRVRWWSAKEFDKPFGPHRFRHAVGTTAPQEVPESPGLAMALLGLSADVYDEHYNRADSARAAARFHETIRREREARRRRGTTERRTSQTSEESET
jgi:site-specific recombinase XerC